MPGGPLQNNQRGKPPTQKKTRSAQLGRTETCVSRDASGARGEQRGNQGRDLVLGPVLLKQRVEVVTKGAHNTAPVDFGRALPVVAL